MLMHLYVDAFICWCIHILVHHMCLQAWQPLLLSTTLHMCAMTHSSVPWLLQMCAMTHSALLHMFTGEIAVAFIHDALYVCAMTHSHVCHDSFICVPWLIYMCAMTRSCVFSAWLTGEIALASGLPQLTSLHTCDMTHTCVCHDSFICVTWLTHMCATTHSQEWQTHWQEWKPRSCVPWLVHTVTRVYTVCLGSYIQYVPWLIHKWDNRWIYSSRVHIPSYVWHDSFICVTWIIHACDMTHSYVWHDSFICVPWLIRMCDMTHSYVCRDTCIRGVPWLIHRRNSLCIHPIRMHIAPCVTRLIRCVPWLIRCVPWLIRCVPWLMHRRNRCCIHPSRMHISSPICPHYR